MRDQSIPQLVLPTHPLTPLPDRTAIRRADPNAAAIRMRVQFWQRMQRHRVYAIVVELQGSGERPTTTPGLLDVRVIMPGCLVTPTDGYLDPTMPEQRNITYVTPLATGGVRYAAVELSRNGQVLQTLSLPEPQIDSHNAWTMIVASMLLPVLLTIGLGLLTPNPNAPGPGNVERFLSDFLPQVKPITDPVAQFLRTGITWLAETTLKYRLGFFSALVLTLFSLIRLAQTRPRAMTVTGPTLVL